MPGCGEGDCHIQLEKAPHLPTLNPGWPWVVSERAGCGSCFLACTYKVSALHDCAAHRALPVPMGAAGMSCSPCYARTPIIIITSALPCAHPAGMPLARPEFMQAQRWGSAFPAQPFGVPCLKAGSAKLVACGDFCLGAGIENAALSAQAAAAAMKEMLEGSS